MDSIDDPQTFQHMGVATKSRFYVVIHPLVKSDSHQLQGSCSLLFTAAVQPAMVGATWPRCQWLYVAGAAADQVARSKLKNGRWADAAQPATTRAARSDPREELANIWGTSKWTQIFHHPNLERFSTLSLEFPTDIATYCYIPQRWLFLMVKSKGNQNLNSHPNLGLSDKHWWEWTQPIPEWIC